MSAAKPDIFRNRGYVISITTRALLVLLICGFIHAAFGQEAERVPVTVFGDGDPYNGVEDSREPLMGGRRSGLGPPSAGAVWCDGHVRGTAVVIDTRHVAPGLPGAVLATAAHVMYDLQKKSRFKRCEFQFLALGAIRGYTAEIDQDRVRFGDFDPDKATDEIQFGEGDWAFLYVPQPWENFRPEQSLPVREFSFARTESFQQSGGEFRSVALDSASGVISESSACTVIDSESGDLGGGAWHGQLLDDCDSGGGASGGGIVAVLEDQRYLVGIRTGSHWSGEVFPSGDYPGGPPAGSVWDPRFNTNFARALDERLIHVLGEFAVSLERGMAF
jgi:hypothetical protein